MKKQELINAPRILFPIGTDVLIKGKIVNLKALDDRFVENVVKLDYGEQIIAPNDAIYVKGEPETGHADEAPRYVKNILARLRELPLHDREVWLKAIMSEFEQDFSHAKWREGYEAEKDKKYKITLLNRNDGDLYLVNQNADLADKYGHFSPVVLLFTKCTNFSEKCYKLTEKEVVSHDFGWVFDCPGIKIEEVE